MIDVLALRAGAMAIAAFGLTVVAPSPTQRDPITARGDLEVGDRVPPRDESASEPGFAAYRTRLLDVVDRRDLTGLKSLLAPTVTVEFSNTYTPDQLIAHLQREPGEIDVFWRTLRRALRLGTVPVGGGMCAPYVYVDAPIGDAAHPWLVITGRNVRLRAGPRDSAPVLATLTYEIVKQGNPELIQPALRRIAAEDPVGDWVFVTTKSNVTGFVRGDYIISTDDTRYCFDNDDGEWKLTGFASSPD